MASQPSWSMLRFDALPQGGVNATPNRRLKNQAIESSRLLSRRRTGKHCIRFRINTGIKQLFSARLQRVKKSLNVCHEIATAERVLKLSTKCKSVKMGVELSTVCGKQVDPVRRRLQAEIRLDARWVATLVVQKIYHTKLADLSMLEVLCR